MLLHFLWNLTTFIIALGILITIHELGHFLAACFCKVKVERFSIGFGPVIWRWRDSNNTEYIISIILLGGYVKLLDTTHAHIVGYGTDNAFNKKNIWQKIIIISSGSIFNFIFSILLYTLVYMIGVPMHKPIINAIIPDSIIASAGIPAGVEIKSVNNISTPDWSAVRMQMLNNIGNTKLIISTTSINNIHLHKYTINLTKRWFDTFTNIADPVMILGIVPDNAIITSIIASIQPNSVAAHSTLKVGDEILSVNGQPIYDWNSFIINIKNNPGKIFKISVKRQQEVLFCYIQPEKDYFIHSRVTERVIGIFPEIIIVPEKNDVICHYKIYHAIFQACHKTWELIYLTINALIKVMFGDIKITYIGGPIAIAKGAGAAANFGLISYLIFLAVININLGIVNLLPLPYLDGGYLLFLILEKINGKLISENIKNFGYVIGFFLLMLIIFFALFNDIYKLWQN